jgi:GNAT superfamily N-acetyltransferase
MSKSSVKIRPLELSDREAWNPLWQGYLSFYKADVSAEVTDTTWKRLLDPSEDMHALCAINPAGEMIGIVHFLYHRVTWSIENRCYLEDLFVSEIARCTGAGRALIEAVYKAADARGAGQVYWLTEDNNHAARKLYDALANKTPFIKYQR